MKKKYKKDELWGHIGEDDFYQESADAIEEDVGEFDLREMTSFIQNVNLMRHLPRLSDSLKPVERRGLYALYLEKAIREFEKSPQIVTRTMKFHPHGDQSVYGTLVGLAQPWNTPVPLIQGFGNFGNTEYSKGYAAMRYTKMRMSKFGFDCFFKDYDPDCIETIYNTAIDGQEPMSLPSKYPNILINGGFGLASGNSFCVPPFHIPDVVKLTKKLLRNPDYDDIYIIPDIPTGCDIVDNGSLREICDTGKGVLRMRSTITIEDNPKKPNVWILHVRNLPWLTDITSVTNRLVELTKNGILPIKDTGDYSYPVKVKDPNGVLETETVLDYRIFINRAHDPEQIKEKLYKLTPLEKSISVDFKVVVDALEVRKLNMRDLCNAWIYTRREYKRRLLNKTIEKLHARLQMLDILITLTSKDNLQKTTKIVQSANEDEVVQALMSSKMIHITSYQAKRVADLKLRAFTKDANARYRNEKKEVEAKLKDCLSKAKSAKMIDDEIEAELDDLMEYSSERKSQVISSERKVRISDTDHFLMISNMGMVKKLPYNPVVMQKKKTPILGIFKNNDYPLHGIVINNMDSVMLFDNFGRFSCLPVHEIDSTEPSQYGTSVYDTAKLNGKIVTAVPFFSHDLQDFIKKNMKSSIYIMSLTKDGYLKKTPINEYTSTRNQLNMRAMKVRSTDELVAGKIVMESKNEGAHILIYTEKGNFAYISSDQIACQSKDASGLLSIKLDPDDACRGMCILGKNDVYLLVVTEKGCLKKCELDYLGTPGKRKMSSYLATTDPTDKVFCVQPMSDTADVTVCTRTSYDVIHSCDIPTKSRKAKCKKMVAVPLGSNIISVSVRDQ